jgi:hypothetical protein
MRFPKRKCGLLNALGGGQGGQEKRPVADPCVGMVWGRHDRHMIPRYLRPRQRRQGPALPGTLVRTACRSNHPSLKYASTTWLIHSERAYVWSVLFDMAASHAVKYAS